MLNIRLETNSAKIQKMCIRNQYYTRGTECEYAHLLERADRNKGLDDEFLDWMANDILRHSDLSYDDEWMELDHIKFNILNEGCYIFSNENIH